MQAPRATFGADAADDMFVPTRDGFDNRRGVGARASHAARATVTVAQRARRGGGADGRGDGVPESETARFSMCQLEFGGEHLAL